jgi:AcrR family transcriptional regulator
VARQRVSREAFRSAILDTASRLFIERGFGGTNMRDIAKALGVTRSAVYYYFPSKQAILEALTREITLVAGRKTTRAAAAGGDAVAVLRDFVHHYAALVLAHPLHFRVVERNETSLPARQRARARAARRNVLENFAAAIERGIRSGHFRPVDARLAAFALIGMCNWTAWWFKEGGRSTSGEVVEVLAELAVHSLRRDGVHAPRRGDTRELIRVIREDLAQFEHLT